MPEHGSPRSPLPDLSQNSSSDLGELGEYRLLEKLGEGGMGAVYKATHTELDRLVAIKVLPAGRLADEEAIARFRREIRAAGQLDHPHIVRALDARRIGQTHFLVMELVDGIDLARLIDRTGPLATADACELIRQAALGLDHVHQCGMIHRDIKPSNLMLDRHGRLKILDLGLAKFRTHAAGEATTAAGQTLGTPDYMAPEQISGNTPLDIRADLYSLGCTFYKLLSGQAPFERLELLVQKLSAHLHQAVPAITQYRDDVLPPLAELVARLVAREPASRYQTPAELVEALAPLASANDVPGLARRILGGPVTPPQTMHAAMQPTPGRHAPVAAQTAQAGHTSPPPVPPPLPRRDVRRQPAGWRQSPRRWATLMLAVTVASVVGLSFFAWHRKPPPSVEPVSNPLPVGRISNPTPEDPSNPLPVGRISNPTPEDPSKPTSLAASTAAALPGWIVLSWTAEKSGRPSLWLFRPDGTWRKQITEDPTSHDVQPCFSPDGRRIAFLRAKPLGGSHAIWICRADGSGARQLVPAQPTERLRSPVWISDSQLVYSRVPRLDRESDAELWEVDAVHGEPRQVLSFQDLLPGKAGLATDASPDGRSLVAIAEQATLWPTADVYLIDWQKPALRPLWEDATRDRKDARPLWSPDGTMIAWHHHFTPGRLNRPIYYGVGLARRQSGGEWKVEFQADQRSFVTPLAWCPDSRLLLCARLDADGTRATLLTVNGRLEQTAVLFELDVPGWPAENRDFGRLADWAIVPADE